MLNPDGRLTINLGALRRNYRAIQNTIGEHCQIGAVVKANGFGLGAKEVVEAFEKEGCKNFFVAKPSEGHALRQTCPNANIYVLNGFFQTYADTYLQDNLIPVISSFIEIADYTALGQQQGRKLPAFLKFNTRMNRMGIASVEQEELWKNPDRLNGIDVKGVISHLACADDPQNPMNETQYGLFQNITEHFPDAIKSLCNSPGIQCGPKYHFDMVRPGASLYGLNPTTGKENPFEPVVSLTLPVIRMRIVYKDAVIGYSAAYRFEKDSPLAIVPAGYADGIPRSLSDRGAFYWQGIRCPIRGRVSMDLTAIDLSDVPEGQRPKPGDMIEVLGPHQDVDALAADADTIGYEILTSLGSRYKREYVDSITQK